MALQIWESQTWWYMSAAAAQELIYSLRKGGRESDAAQFR